MTDEPPRDPSSESPAEPLARALPTAHASARRRPSLAWIVPFLALGVAIWMVVEQRGETGPTITVRALEGHGIRPGDPIRYRGIDVGRVESVELEPDLETVVLDARIAVEAQRLAREGTRFWIVRPHLSLDEVTGLETIIGARYLEAMPGEPSDVVQTEFVALEEPPVIVNPEPGGLEIVLIAPSRFGVKPGAPITYRHVEIGRVLSIGLASDASSLEMRTWIEPEYSRLVRDNTQFWEDSGLDVEFGLFDGVSVGLESVRALFVGAVSMATPDTPGEAVSNGHRFPLAEEAKEAWLEWRPSLPVGGALLPNEAPTPRPMRAVLTWKDETFLGTRRREVRSWVLPVGSGLVGPAEVLAPGDLGDKLELKLEVAGTHLPVPGRLRWEENDLALVEDVGALGIPWPTAWLRSPTEPEDVLVVGDSAVAPFAISAARLSRDGETWKLDGSLGIDDTWHGASVFSRVDGHLVGLLLADDEGRRIAPWPAQGVAGPTD